MTDFTIRSFRNADPPELVRIWTHQPRLRGLAREVDVNSFEAIVLAKPYFDRHGLIVAEQKGRLVGFVHAGFGPDADERDISTELGVTCVLMVDPGAPFGEVGSALMRASEAYLKARGARVLYAGGISPLNPFYLGLYGGSELPGIVRGDERWIELLRRGGYQPVDQCHVLHRELDSFKPPMDRHQLMLKRSYRVVPANVPLESTWWKACTAPPHEAMQFELVPLAGGAAVASLQYWLMDPLCRGWGVLAAGLIRLSVVESCRRQGMGTMLVAESMRQIRMSGVQLTEAQTMFRNQAALGLYQKLGFREVDQGMVFRKSE